MWQLANRPLRIKDTYNLPLFRVCIDIILRYYIIIIIINTWPSYVRIHIRPQKVKYWPTCKAQHVTTLQSRMAVTAYLKSKQLSAFWLCRADTSKHKAFVYHLCTVGPTSSTLVQHCTNVIQMFCVYWAISLPSWSCSFSRQAKACWAEYWCIDDQTSINCPMLRKNVI